MSLWLMMIFLHAICAVTSLATGFALLSPLRVRKYPVLIRLFITSLSGMMLFMVAATVSHWSDISATERIIFASLPLLGIYMLYRGYTAMMKLRLGTDVGYIDDVGFTLISLLNGFIIVALIDVGAPPFLIPIAAVGATILGSKYIASVKRARTHSLQA